MCIIRSYNMYYMELLLESQKMKEKYDKTLNQEI